MSEHVLTDEEAQEIIDCGTKAWELVRLVFPSAPEGECDFILWEFTPYPMVTGVHDIVDSLADALARGVFDD